VYSRNSGCSASTHSTSQVLACSAMTSAYHTSRPSVKAQAPRGAALQKTETPVAGLVSDTVNPFVLAQAPLGEGAGTAQGSPAGQQTKPLPAEGFNKRVRNFLLLPCCT
jgi:hypothetical protein